MHRTIWSGAISFGLVTVPCHVQSATENHSIRFHQYHLEDMARVRVRKVCELEDREVGQSEIGKGYEYAKDQVVAITDEELRELPRLRALPARRAGGQAEDRPRPVPAPRHQTRMNPDRYHLTLTSAGRRVMQGWWGIEATAGKQLSVWVGSWGELPEARITLVDEETGETLTEWPAAT